MYLVRWKITNRAPTRFRRGLFPQNTNRSPVIDEELATPIEDSIKSSPGVARILPIAAPQPAAAPLPLFRPWTAPDEKKILRPWTSSPAEQLSSAADGRPTVDEEPRPYVITGTDCDRPVSWKFTVEMSTPASKLSGSVDDRQAADSGYSSLPIGSTPQVDTILSADEPRQVKRARFPQKTTDLYEAWYRANFNNPYIDEDALVALAAEGGTSVEQLRKFLANRRARTGNTLRHNGIVHPRTQRRLQREAAASPTAGCISVTPSFVGRLPSQSYPSTSTPIDQSTFGRGMQPSTLPVPLSCRLPFDLAGSQRRHADSASHFFNLFRAKDARCRLYSMDSLQRR